MLSGSWESEDTLTTKKNYIRDVKLKPSESMIFTIVQDVPPDSEDGAPLGVLEHKIYTQDESFAHVFISPKTHDASARDPLIEKGFYPKKVRKLVGIREELPTNRGPMKNVKQILTVPPKLAEFFREFISTQREEMDDPSKFTLVGCKFKVKRSEDPKSPAVGDTWISIGRMSEEQMIKKGYDLTPLPSAQMYTEYDKATLEALAAKAIKYEDKFFKKHNDDQNSRFGKNQSVPKAPSVGAAEDADEIPF